MYVEHLDGHHLNEALGSSPTVLYWPIYHIILLFTWTKYSLYYCGPISTETGELLYHGKYSMFSGTNSDVHGFTIPAHIVVTIFVFFLYFFQGFIP